MTNAEKAELGRLEKEVQVAAAAMDVARTAMREKSRLLARAEGALDDYQVKIGLKQ